MHNSFSQECHSQAGSVGKRDSLPGSAISNFSEMSTGGSGGSARSTCASASHSTNTTSKRGLPWWKLTRPVRQGRRRSLADLSTNNINSRCVASNSQQEKQQRKQQHAALSSGEGILFGVELGPFSSSSSSPSPSASWGSASSEEWLASTEKQHQHQNHQGLGCSHGTLVESTGTEAPSSREGKGRARDVVARSGGAKPHTIDTDTDTVPVSRLLAHSDGSERCKAADNPLPADDSDRNRRTVSEEDPTDPRAPLTPTTPVRAYSSPFNSANTATATASATLTIALSGGSDVVGGRGVVSAYTRKSKVAAAVCTAMSCDSDEEEGMDDETALSRPSRPRTVYDILAVDRGCGNCDTSVVPFSVKDEGEVGMGQIRAVTAGQGDFLARRGFASGLVAHFLEETNCEFRALQGKASEGMDSRQLEEAAARLEEVFAPAVKRLRVKQSTEVVLDSLFEGADDAGPFVVRFEVVITRCHPEDLEVSGAEALKQCAPAIREAMSGGVKEREMHEVVFVGRPMWELVSPVLDFSDKAAEEKAGAG